MKSSCSNLIRKRFVHEVGVEENFGRVGVEEISHLVATYPWLPLVFPG